MDYRQKVLTIVAVCSFVLLVFLVVVLSNPHKREYSGVEEKEVAAGTDQEQVGDTAPEHVISGGQIGNDLSAFLSAKDFFDDNSDDSIEAETVLPKASMMILSVEKDLRIRILDSLGNLITGEKFIVDISGQGEFKDTDANGIIYVDGLAAGEYSVTLHDTQNYVATEETVRVRVKEKVEYIEIKDINVLILTEKDIDPTVEDTGIKEAENEADSTEMMEIAGSLDAVFGIDVSKWNKEIDWEMVAAAGVKYAIIRCGYRGSSSGSLVEDPYFRQNLVGAMNAGIEVGVYFFTQAIDEVEAVEEASMVLSLLEGYRISYPIFIDTEGAGGNGRADFLQKDQRTKVCKAFCETIENAGHISGIYASRNWFHNNLNTGELEQYTIWLAEYSNQVKYSGKYDFWQYTSKGRLEGIDGNVDFNISYWNKE